MEYVQLNDGNKIPVVGFGVLITARWWIRPRKKLTQGL